MISRKTLRSALWLCGAALLIGCNITGVPEKGQYNVGIDVPDCVVPAPIINDMTQKQTTMKSNCPFNVRLADGSLILVYLTPFIQPHDTTP